MSSYSGGKVCDVPWEKLYIGMEVISARGIPGKIILLDPEDRYPSVEIKWNHGGVSSVFYHQLEHVMVA